MKQLFVSMFVSPTESLDLPLEPGNSEVELMTVANAERKKQKSVQKAAKATVKSAAKSSVGNVEGPLTIDGIVHPPARRSAIKAMMGHKMSEDGSWKKRKPGRTAQSHAEGKKPKILKNNPLVLLDPALAEFLGSSTESRPVVVRKIWEYIKEHDLQDPSDRRMILCDEKLLPVMGVERVSMFKMNAILFKQMKHADDVVSE
jgi:chromatin remodeling complex protein RSC6